MEENASSHSSASASDPDEGDDVEDRDGDGGDVVELVDKEDVSHAAMSASECWIPGAVSGCARRWRLSPRVVGGIAEREVVAEEAAGERGDE